MQWWSTTAVASTANRFQTWITDGPSERGTESMKRMSPVHDDIPTRAAARNHGVPAGGPRAR